MVRKHFFPFLVLLLGVAWSCGAAAANKLRVNNRSPYCVLAKAYADGKLFNDGKVVEIDGKDKSKSTQADDNAKSSSLKAPATVGGYFIEMYQVEKCADRTASTPKVKKSRDFKTGQIGTQRYVVEHAERDRSGKLVDFSLRNISLEEQQARIEYMRTHGMP